MNAKQQNFAVIGGGNEVLVREFKNQDLHDCQEIFT